MNEDLLVKLSTKLKDKYNQILSSLGRNGDNELTYTLRVALSCVYESIDEVIKESENTK